MLINTILPELHLVGLLYIITIGGVRLGVSETAFFHSLSPCIAYTMILLVIPVPRLLWLHFSLLESAFGIRPYRGTVSAERFEKHSILNQSFSIAGPQPGTGHWHQLYRAARGFPGICHFTFLGIFH